MMLITDGGSTKCDWIMMDDDWELVFKTTTRGLNPNVVSKDEIRKSISSNEDLAGVKDEALEINFFGSGCGAPKSREVVEDVLKELFPNSKVTVKEDTVGAVRAVTSQPGIVCILGTGSNSCFFDGNTIHQPIPSLGYVLMDESGANFYGKQLINDYYYGRMPEEIARDFEKSHNLKPDDILFNLYKEDSPSVYLASFARFVFSEDADRLKIPYFHKLVSHSVRVFAENRILTFKNAHEVPIHFIGTISHLSKPVIEEVFAELGLKLGNVVRYPIEGLMEYYRGRREMLDDRH